MGHQTKAENYENGSNPDGTGGILRIKQDGKIVGKGILGDMESTKQILCIWYKK